MAIDLSTPAEAISEANTLFSGLIIDAPSLPTFPVAPDIDIELPGDPPDDLTIAIPVITLDQLTEGATGGEGVFDKLMSSVNTHIENQYNKGTLGKSEIAEVYVAAIQATLPQAINFLVASQLNHWQAKLVQIQTQNAWLERARLSADLQTARMIAFKTQAETYIAQVGALTAQTTFANSKMDLASKLQQINSQETQEGVLQAQYDAAYVQTHNTLPGGGTVGGSAAKDLLIKDSQIALQLKQQALMDSQINVQRAQTYDTNTDTTAVAGVIGTQKALYTQQIDSYVQDGKNKGVKVVADLWTSAKALDDAIQSPGPLAGNLMMAMNTYLNGLGLPNAMVSADSPATGAPSTDTNWNIPGKQV